MTKADKIDRANRYIAYIGGAIGLFLLWRGKKKAQAGEDGVGTLVKTYTATLLKRYFSSVPVYDVQIADNKKFLWVLCGDAQGGREFYISSKNEDLLIELCEKYKVDYWYV